MNVESIEWPFVGRDREIVMLRRSFNAPSRGAIVVGSAGVGKTRFVNEALVGEETHSNILRVAGSPGLAHVPLGVFTPFVPSLADLVETEPTRLTRHVAAYLMSQAERARLLIFVDDAHLMDEVSAAVLAQLVAQREVFTVLALRSGESAPDAVTNLWKDGLAKRIDLAPLGVDESAELVSRALSGVVDSSTSDWLAARSAGSPLFLRELIMGALNAGALRCDDGVWGLRGSPFFDSIIKLTLSDRIVDILRIGLRGLSDADREVLLLVAFGEPLAVSILERLCRFETLQSLERRGLLVVGDGPHRPEMRLAHALYGDVLRSRTPALTARAVYRRLAAAMKAEPEAIRPADLLRLASWQLNSDEPVQADLMMEAARTARLSGDPGLAERLAQAAVDAGAGFDACLLLAEAKWLCGRGEAAEQLLTSLESHVDTDAQRAVLASTRMDVLGLGLGRVHDAMRVGEVAEARISTLADRDEVAVKRAQLLLQTGHTKDAWMCVEPILERAVGRTFVAASMTAVSCLTFQGKFSAAEDVISRGRAVYSRLTEALPALAPDCYAHLEVMCQVFAGRLQQALTLAQLSYQRALGHEDPVGLGFSCIALAYVYLAQGRVTMAARFARDATLALRDQSTTPFMSVAVALLVQALALTDRTSEARTAVAQLESLDAPSLQVLNVQRVRARAWGAVAEGKLSQARDMLVDGANIARDRGEQVFEACVLHDLARLGFAKQAHGRLTELASLIEGTAASLAARHARAIAASDVEELTCVADEFEVIGAHLHAAEAACTAAVTMRINGFEGRLVTAMKRRAALLTARCEGARTPALGAVEAQVTLTAREFEVAALAAHGHTNRVIAEILTVSVRTVENQLQRAYDKLGVCSRNDLAESLSDLDRAN
jgi:DNA-binding CsgD family transcriptional regulator